MLSNVIVGLVLKYVVDQLEKTGAATDWAKVKTDFAAECKDHLGDKWITSELVVLGDTLIDDIAAACKKPDDVKAVLSAVAAKDYPAAAAALKVLVKGVAGANPYIAALLAA